MRDPKKGIKASMPYVCFAFGEKTNGICSTHGKV